MPYKTHFYIPNVLGYIRIVLVCVFLGTFKKHPFISVLVLFLAQFLDMLDGYFARKLNQNSNLGVVLDMCIDRITYLAFYFALLIMQPNLFYGVLFLAVLDHSSHYARIYACQISKITNHKELISRYKLLNYYYGSKTFLTALIIGENTFLASVYLSSFYQLSGMLLVVFCITFVLFLLKQIINMVQLIHSLMVVY